MENNPVNYIDPSGHRQELNKDWGGGRGKPKLEPQTGATRPPYDPSRPGGPRDANMDLLADAMGAGRPISFKEMAERGVHIPTAHLQAHAAYYGHHYANNQSAYNETSYNWAKEQLNQRIQQLETDYQNATGGLGKKRLRETADMLKNWTKELEESIRHICDPNTAKAGDKDGWKAIESAKVTDAILTKYAEQYGLNKEYLSKNRHLISYFAQLEEQAKNPQPPNRLSIQIFSGLMGAIATGLGGPTAGFTTYGALNSGLTSHFINKDDGWTVLGKTILGGVTGGLAGASLAKIGIAKLGFLARTLLESGVETSLDTGISAINGDEITVGSVLSNFGLNTVINGVFNGLGDLRSPGTKPDESELPPVNLNLEQLNPREIANMTIDEVEARLPDGWYMEKHDPFYHIYDRPKVKGEKRLQRVRFDPPDPNTPYYHVHVYNENYELVDIDGNVVDESDPAGHIESNYRNGN